MAGVNNELKYGKERQKPDIGYDILSPEQYVSLKHFGEIM